MDYKVPIITTTNSDCELHSWWTKDLWTWPVQCFLHASTRNIITYTHTRIWMYVCVCIYMFSHILLLRDEQLVSELFSIHKRTKLCQHVGCLRSSNASDGIDTIPSSSAHVCLCVCLSVCLSVCEFSSYILDIFFWPWIRSWRCQDFVSHREFSESRGNLWGRRWCYVCHTVTNWYVRLACSSWVTLQNTCRLLQWDCGIVGVDPTRRHHPFKVSLTVFIV